MISMMAVVEIVCRVVETCVTLVCRREVGVKEVENERG